ncbi:unnamed protein product [Lathyrus oleraceus]
MAINSQPSCECIRLIFLKLFAVSFSSSIIFLLVITFAPSNVKFHVTEASLTMFNLTSNNILDYKLEANITSRNINKNMEMYHKKIIAIAWYEENDFARVNLASFDQGHRNTTFLNVASERKSVMELEPEQLFEYNEEARLGIYKDYARVNLSCFDQGHKNATFLYLVFGGSSVIKPKPKQLFEYYEEMRLGIYNESFFYL